MVLTTPCFPPDVANAYGGAAIWRDQHRLTWVNGVWREFAARHPGSVSLGDLGVLLCPNGKAVDTASGAAVRTDGIHFTATGASTVWSWIAALPDVAAAHTYEPGRRHPTTVRLRP